MIMSVFPKQLTVAELQHVAIHATKPSQQALGTNYELIAHHAQPNLATE